uniref:C-type lectin domain-containing protein n=1 Tax=Acrobeloides nanus TaxID=290746 RepID=A0A914DUS8_9BILA
MSSKNLVFLLALFILLLEPSFEQIKEAIQSNKLDDGDCSCYFFGPQWLTLSTKPCKCYYVGTQLDWFEAYKNCESEDYDGGFELYATLISIDSAFDNQKIRMSSNTTSASCTQVFIGLTKKGNDWTWVNGENLTYTNWRSGYPDNNILNGCALLNLSDGKWTNVPCIGLSTCYACETIL